MLNGFNSAFSWKLWKQFWWVSRSNIEGWCPQRADWSFQQTRKKSVEKKWFIIFSVSLFLFSQQFRHFQSELLVLCMKDLLSLIQNSSRVSYDDHVLEANMFKDIVTCIIFVIDFCTFSCHGYAYYFVLPILFLTL